LSRNFRRLLPITFGRNTHSALTVRTTNVPLPEIGWPAAAIPVEAMLRQIEPAVDGVGGIIERGETPPKEEMTYTSVPWMYCAILGVELWEG
jgi:hypothetical protein